MTTFSRTLALLLESGTPITKSLEIASDTIDNVVYRDILLYTKEKVKGGQTLAKCLGEFPKQFPPSYLKMIQVGEKTGTLEENLYYLYEFHTEEVKDFTNNMTTLLEPILLVFIGMTIGLLAITIVAPIYQLTGSINE